MRDYDEIISTLTEDEKIQLVLAKTSFTKELCDKIDDNLYSRNDNFLGLFTEYGLQITDSNGCIIANNIRFDENNTLKLYAKYN